MAIRAGTGQRPGILDGATVTARRIAALSSWPRRRSPPVPMAGCASSGPACRGARLEAFREGLGREKVFVYSRGRKGPTLSPEGVRAEHGGGGRRGG